MDSLTGLLYISLCCSLQDSNKKTVGVIAFDFSFKNVNLIIKEEVNNSRNLKAENIISSHQAEIIVNGLLLLEFLKEKLSVFPT